MTNRERILAVFEGRMVGAVPFALKGWRIPQCTLERRLRNNGMAILAGYPVVTEARLNTKTIRQTEHVQGLDRTRTIVETPKGIVTWVDSSNPAAPRSESTSWTEEFPFKNERDYEAIEFWIGDRIYRPNYEPFLRAMDYIGDDAAFKADAPGSPLHTLMYNIMGIETFAEQLADNEERVMRLYRLLQDKYAALYEIVAKSPARIVMVGGNYCPEVLGKKRFMEFVVPHWKEVCDLLHEEGKWVGCHLDANNKLWAKEVGESALDWIESFSPAPSSDMSVAEARQAWPGKTLFVNFPSVIHLAEPSVIRETTLRILREAAPGDRLIVGIAENVPDNRWPISFPVILDTVNEFGRLPITLT